MLESVWLKAAQARLPSIPQLSVGRKNGELTTIRHWRTVEA